MVAASVAREVLTTTWRPTRNGTENALTATLPAGNYYAYLYNWTLERKDDNGNFQPVAATLNSSYYQQSFVIYNQFTTSISYQFVTDGVIVVVGNGQLNVAIGVNEIPPACTILGNDCPSGQWCAPPGLTGTSLTCVVAGYTPVGASCTAPTDCQANASCMDLGAGPTCTALCPVANAGSPCSSGGTCTKASIDYGVCVPNGETLPDAGAGGGGGTGGYPATGGAYSVGGSTGVYVTGIYATGGARLF